jgi:hypothetical protein
MARLHKVKELGFDIDKTFVLDTDEIAYNEAIDAALKRAGWE